jgi:hypothetical protein
MIRGPWLFATARAASRPVPGQGGCGISIAATDRSRLIRLPSLLRIQEWDGARLWSWI